MTAFRVALAQLESTIGSKDFDPRPDNLARAERAIADASSRGADLVVFGETFLTGYHTGAAAPLYALHVDGPDPTVDAVSRMAADHGVEVVIGAGTVHDSEPRDVQNSAVFIGPDGVRGVYAKVHLPYGTEPNGTVHDEREYFTAGTEIPVWSTDRFGTIGPQVCFDVHYAEVGRVQMIQGAEVLVNISASLTGFERSWQNFRGARAFENNAWFINCSIVGTQNGERYFGRSSVVDPLGEVIVEAADGVEDLVVADIDTSMSTHIRSLINTVSSRRPDIYTDLTQPLTKEVPS